MSKNVYLAADFGGGSGRVIAGWLDQGRIVMEEVHRFGNRQVRLGEHVYWDFPALFEDMKDGLKKAAARGYSVKSIGIDTVIMIRCGHRNFITYPSKKYCRDLSG